MTVVVYFDLAFHGPQDFFEWKSQHNRGRDVSFFQEYGDVVFLEKGEEEGQFFLSQTKR